MPTVKVRNLQNKEIGDITLSDAVFGVELNEGLIHAAVMNCVARCSESDVPTVTMVDFLDRLAELGWGEKDIAAVQRGVLPLLGELKTGDTVTWRSDRMTAH